MVELAGDCGVCGRVAAGFIPRWTGRRGADRREGPRPFMDIASGCPLELETQPLPHADRKLTQRSANVATVGNMV